MKFKIEISPGCEEEIILRAPEATERIRRLQSVIENALEKPGELMLYDAGKEYYVAKNMLDSINTCTCLDL